MLSLWQDIRYGFRMLLKNPMFSVIAIATLALGIGANTALFSVINGVLLNPLPYPNADRLIALYSKTAEFSRSSISYPNFLDWQRGNRSFELLAAYRSDSLNLTGQGEAERLRTAMISWSFFPVLGVNPALGRNFTEQEDKLGSVMPCGTGSSRHPHRSSARRSASIRSSIRWLASYRRPFISKATITIPKLTSSCPSASGMKRSFKTAAWAWAWTPSAD